MAFLIEGIRYARLSLQAGLLDVQLRREQALRRADVMRRWSAELRSGARAAALDA